MIMIILLKIGWTAPSTLASALVTTSREKFGSAFGQLWPFSALTKTIEALA